LFYKKSGKNGKNGKFFRLTGGLKLPELPELKKKLLFLYIYRRKNSGKALPEFARVARVARVGN